jgi:hypothetical protein
MNKESEFLQSFDDEATHLKMGIYGSQGSGKTHTASIIMLGLAKMFDKKKVGFFDTEDSAKFVNKRIFKPAGIEVKGRKSRSFQDLLKMMDICDKKGIDLIIDSLTHVWDELKTAYRIKKKRSFISLYDYGPIKELWKPFVQKLISSNIHIIVCGRAGSIYEEREDENGKKEAHVVGKKMRAETETGHEPDLVWRMFERVEYDERENIQNRFHMAQVEKDRSGVIDSKLFQDPTFDSIRPYIEWLDIGGKSVPLDFSQNSQDMIDDPDYSRENRKKRKEVAIGEIKATFDKYQPGSSAEAKRKKVEISEQVFSVRSWEAIVQIDVDTLEAIIHKDETGTSILDRAFLGKPEPEKKEQGDGWMDKGKKKPKSKKGKDDLFGEDEK